MEDPIIAASILSADIAYLAHEVQDAVSCGTDWLHLDVMDGSFVPPITFGDNVVKALKGNVDRMLDVHLMIEKPEKHVEDFVKAGADFVTIHTEATEELAPTLAKIRELGARCGVAINPGTSVDALEPVLSQVDLVLVMTVNPGWGGQKFIETCIPKIEWAAEQKAKNNYSYFIEIDGGVNPQTARESMAAGAEVFVAGSYIFSAKNRKDAIDSLRAALDRRELLN